MGVDLLIKNGKVYTEDSGFCMLDVGVTGEKIAFLAEPGAVKDEDAGRVIDATGKHVLPGIIDWHTHVREPGFEHKEDYLTGTQAAAHGGVTMVCPQPNLDPAPRTLEAYKLQIDLASEKAVVDFHPIPSPLGFKEGEVEKIADYGAAWFKIFQKVDKYPYATAAGTCDTSEILGAFKAVAAADRWCSVHPWDKWFHDAATQSVRDEGLPMVTENVRPRWYDNEEMAGAMYQLYYLAKKAGMKWYAMHAWMPDSIDLVRLAKKEGVIPVVGSFELMPSIDPAEHLYYPEKGEWSKWDISHDAVPDEDYMWASVMDGTIDFIGTDHAPHSRKDYEYLLEEKPADWIPASLGYPLLDWHGHLLLNKVNKGYLTLEKLVEATSVNGAKIFGFYPNKGSNLPGTDADFTIVDMEKEWAINSDHVYTKSGLNSYHGRKIKGQVTHTIVRGSVVMENDEVIGKPGFGKFIKPVK